MPQRPTRGVMVGVFDQVSPGYASVRTIEEPIEGGRVTFGGIRVQPSQVSDVPAGDPLVLTASRAAGDDIEPQTPRHAETREAAQQDVIRFPLWLLLAAVAVAVI